jgi:hypothetical protein
MAEAARSEGITPRAMSFKGALHTVREFEAARLYDPESTRWPGRRRSGSPCGPGRRAAAGRRDWPARDAPVPAARRRRCSR